MEMMDHLIAEGRIINENNKDSQMGQVTPKKALKKTNFAGPIEFVTT